MRNLLILSFLCLALTLSGATYYVSPSGKDSNPGSIDLPFFSLNKAWAVVSAGDIVYMRGGTYVYSVPTEFRNKSGTSVNLIKIWGYPGEKPVIDYSSFTPTQQIVGIYLNTVNYIHIKGIRIANINQPVSNDIAQYGIMLRSNVNSCVFEQIETDHIGGWGVSIFDNCSNNMFLNCDSHHNQDPSSPEPYGGADGFQCGSPSSTNTTFRGCRSWWNSDDGWDLRMTNGNYTFENCWSFWNGYVPGTFNKAGNGEGMKVGGDGGKRLVTNCLVFENRFTGIENSDNGGSTDFQLYNTVCYKNGEGMNFNYGHPAVLKNNISYQNSGNNDNFRDGSNTTHNHNSFDSPVTVSDADFISVSSVGMNGPRLADGSLPVLNFLKLSNGSDLIDAGVNVGIPYSGNAPDIGALELTSGSAPVIPTYVSSSVENATPSLLEMTYNQALANVAPAASAFSVRVNTVARTVNTVTISGTKVQLTLASPIVYGDVLTIAYTLPAGNPIQTSSGGQAVTISAQTVSNKVVSAIPVYVSSVIENATPSLLTMTYTLSLANVLPSASSFNVQVNGVARSVSTVAISTSTVRLTLASASKFGDVITVSYTKPATNPLQTASGAQAVNVSAKPVTNNITSPTKDLVPFKITMTISPNPVHRNINISFVYTGTFSKLDPATSPQIIRIFNSNGALKVEKLVETGISKVRFPINLRAGIYTVVQLSGGVSMSSQMIIVN